MARRPSRSQLRRFEDLADKLDPSIRQAFIIAAQYLVDAADFAALIRALEVGDVDAAMNALNIRASSFRAVDRAIMGAFEAGGIAALVVLPPIKTRAGVRIRINFDIRHPAAEGRLQRHLTGRIGGFTQEAERVARQVLTKGLAAGNGPRQTARELLGSINRATGKREGGLLKLAANQAQWVENARRELDSGNASPLAKFLTRAARDKRFDGTVRKAIRTGEPLTSDQVDKLINRYSERLLKSRAETIARTETIEALNSSKLAGYAQVADETGAGTQTAVKKWVAAVDERTRTQHAAMNGVEVIGLDTPFTMPDGSLMLHPCDSSLGAGARQIINCRCTFSVRLDYRDTL
nr:MAG TPA: minor capsid component [Caudoviricetes sp.]